MRSLWKRTSVGGLGVMRRILLRSSSPGHGGQLEGARRNRRRHPDPDGSLPELALLLLRIAALLGAAALLRNEKPGRILKPHRFLEEALPGDENPLQSQSLRPLPQSPLQKNNNPFPLEELELVPHLEQLVGRDESLQPPRRLKRLLLLLEKPLEVSWPQCDSKA
jgi:hypothetical protein